MRMMPARARTVGKPLQVKRVVSQVEHIVAPLKGLDLSTQKTTGKPLTGPVLDNWVINEQRCDCRPGTKLLYTDTALRPIETIIPYYGFPADMALATNEKLMKVDGSVLKAGFTSNDWSWTSFANLGQQQYTLMANGTDGIWSWNGGDTQDSAPVSVVSISKANPAVVTVAAADIGKFSNGQNVHIAGATGTWAICNGNRVIASVNAPANTFTLLTVDTVAAVGTPNAGITAVALGSVIKETITAPASSMPWFDVNRVHIILTHQNRVWMADRDNLAVYYLPLQQKTGEVKQLPLSALFKRGGTVRAVYTWSIDGGGGMDDKLVIFSSNNECAIYAGTDPDTDFSLVGVFRFDSPMSKHCVVNYGGELHVLISTGLMPLSVLMRAETQQLGNTDKGVVSAFQPVAEKYRDRNGWQVILDHSTGRMICNMPLGAANRYKQMVRKMPTTFYSSWSALPSRCWQWIDSRLYIGTDDGRLLEVSPNYLSDAGQPIRVDMQPSWSNFKTPAFKDFKMIRPYITTDGEPKPFVDVKVDYDTSPPVNQPDVSFSQAGADWETGTWDEDFWAGGDIVVSNWNGVASAGNVGAPRLVAFISNCHFGVSGFDVIFEQGSIMG